MAAKIISDSTRSENTSQSKIRENELYNLFVLGKETKCFVCRSYLVSVEKPHFVVAGGKDFNKKENPHPICQGCEFHLSNFCRGCHPQVVQMKEIDEL